MTTDARDIANTQTHKGRLSGSTSSTLIVNGLVNGFLSALAVGIITATALAIVAWTLEYLKNEGGLPPD